MLCLNTLLKLIQCIAYIKLSSAIGYQENILLAQDAISGPFLKEMLPMIKALLHIIIR